MLAEAQGALRAICQQAANGDPAMCELFCRYVLPRIVPVRRGVPVPFDLAGATDRKGMLIAILNSAAHGDLSAEEAESLSRLAQALPDLSLFGF